MQHVIYVVITNVIYMLLHHASAQTSDVFALKPELCRSAALPEHLIEWQENLSASYISVEWGYGNTTCSSMNNCFGMKLHRDVALEPQILPIQIQPGMEIRFFASPHTDVDFSILVYNVDEIGFRSCDATRGRAITDGTRQAEFTVNPIYLSTGTNYFIANTTDPMFECHYGLRLNVTVRERECRKPGSATVCSERGRCVADNIQPRYGCKCCHGYTGRFCDDNDACASYPCQNGGTCTHLSSLPGQTNFRCDCPLGTSGIQCEQRVPNMCDVTPCANGATCLGTPSNYTCLCSHGYTGYHCEVDSNNCESKPCIHGVCVDQLGSHKCYCTPGYGGANCEREFDECKSNPCKNGGFCLDKEDGFQCQCVLGYSGDDCSIKVNLCDPSPCHNATECVDYGDSFSCTCRPGFTGIHCEINMNECDSNPCLNNGLCRDLVAGYICRCEEGTSGVHCQYRHVDLPERRPPLVMEKESPLRGGHLYIIAGTLAGALLIALVVLTGCYCKVHETYRKLYCKRWGYSRQHNDTLRSRQTLTTHQIVQPFPDNGPSMDAIMDASSAPYDDSTIHAPLFNSLRPKRV